MKFTYLFPLHRFFFSLLLIFLPTQFGLHLWPEWSLILGRRVDYLAPTLFVTDMLLVLTVACWMIEVYRKRKAKKENYQKTFFILFTFLFFAAINIFFASSPMVAVYGWLKFFEYFCLGYYIVQTKPAFSFIVPHVFFGVFYSSFIAIAQFFLHHSIGSIFWFLGERTFSVDTPGIAKIEICQQSAYSCQLFLRAYGLFPHPNVLGGYLATMAPLLIIYHIKKYNFFKTLTITLGFIALILTFSRSAWSALIIGSWFMVHGLWINKNTYKYINIISIISVIFFVIYIGKTIALTDESVVVRQQLNAAAIAQWRQSPFVGVGLGNFLVHLPNTLVSRQIYFLQPVHNIYLLLLSEVGIVGIGIIAASILLMHGARNKRYATQKFSELFLIRTSLFMLLFIGLVDHYPLTLQQGQLLLTLLFSLSLAYRHN